jgi:hypothetical protein
MRRMPSIQACFAHSYGPVADPLLHATMIEDLLLRHLHRTRAAAGEEDPRDVLDRWLAELRRELLVEAESLDREYRLQVLDIAAQRLRGRIRALAHMLGAGEPLGGDPSRARS